MHFDMILKSRVQYEVLDILMLDKESVNGA